MMGEASRGSVGVDSTVIQTKIELDRIFTELAQHLQRENAVLIMPTFYPQEGAVLQEFAELGVSTHIYGPGGQIFPNVPHTRVAGVASNVDSETPENIQKIIDSINLEDLRNRKVYIYQFMHYEWRNLLQKRIDEYNSMHPDNLLNCTICADMTMGHEQLFEGKHELAAILEETELERHKIPGTVASLMQLRDEPLSEANIKRIFGIQSSDQTGKIVVQFCGEEYQEVGGGQGTIIFENYEEYAQALRLFKTPDQAEEERLPENSKVRKFLVTARENTRAGVSLKVSKYIEGIEGNLSFIVLPSYTNQEGIAFDIRGRKFRPIGIAAQMQDLTLSEERTRIIPARMTLKCVGDSRLTTKSGSGVGNDLGYGYGETVAEAITQICMQLGRYMALNGDYGLVGCDIKLTPDGKIYIIEINNRQQGPTAGMSTDGEAKGAPSLIKMQTIYNFGTLEQISRMQEVLAEKERLIAGTYMSPGGSFYIKFANVNEGAVSPISLRPGYYFVARGEDGRWHWDLQHTVPEREAKSLMRQNNLASGRVVLGLKGCSFEAGKHFELDEQMAKIVGFSSPSFPGPFTINPNRTKVILQNDFWTEAIYDLRSQIGPAHHAIEVATPSLAPSAPVLHSAPEVFCAVSTPVVRSLATQSDRSQLDEQLVASAALDLSRLVSTQQSLDIGEHVARLTSSREIGPQVVRIF